MIRRLLFAGLVTYGVVLLFKARTKRTTRKQHANAEADWDSEGGTPAPDPVDTPVPA